jgi:membrane-associated phospholipid phosphatase
MRISNTGCSGAGRHRGWRWMAALGLVAGLAGTAEAQPGACSAADAEPGPVHSVTGWELVGTGAATAGLFLVDRPILNFLQQHRSKELDAVADVFRSFGSPPVYGAISAGVLGAGLISGDADIRRAGGRLIFSYLVTAAATQVLKMAVGRSRPDARKGPYDFGPFKNRQVSFPSGHTAIAFTLATSLADDIGDPWVSAGLYTLAAGTAWSRLNDGRHWPSDVLTGAGLGIASAKMVRGRWRVFGIESPEWIRADQLRHPTEGLPLRLVPRSEPATWPGRSFGCAPAAGLR